MIKQIKTTLESGLTQTVIITKKTQIYDQFLTSRHPTGSYPIVSDTSKHLNKGDQIIIERIQNSKTDPSWSFMKAFKCTDSNGNEFFLFENDVKRFTTLHSSKM